MATKSKKLQKIKKAPAKKAALKVKAKKILKPKAVKAKIKTKVKVKPKAKIKPKAAKIVAKSAVTKAAVAVKIAVKPVAPVAPVVPPRAPVYHNNYTNKVVVQREFVSKDKFRTGVKVVYPSHGVGEIKGIETHVIAGTDLKTYVIEFEKEKMLLRIPANRAERSGLRPLSSDDELKIVRSTLMERPKSSRGMWSRRAKEYETKINSGNIISVAEVVRDLHKNVDDPERSYSERVIYENALERLSREVSAVKKMDIPEAADYLVKTINDNNPYFLKKAAAKKAAEDAELEGEDSIAA